MAVSERQELKNLGFLMVLDRVPSQRSWQVQVPCGPQMPLRLQVLPNSASDQLRNLSKTGSHKLFRQPRPSKQLGIDVDVKLRRLSQGPYEGPELPDVALHVASSFWIVACG